MKTLKKIIKSSIVVTITLSSISFSTNLFAGSGGKGDVSNLWKSAGKKEEPPEARNPIAKLGPFAVGYAFCKKIQTIAPILNAYSSVKWPVTGAPGITMGLVQNESVLLKICDYLVQLRTLDTEGAIYLSANFLNTITEKKWDDHFSQADLLWNTANSLYDFRGDDGFKKGALTQAYTHKQLIDFVDKSMKWSKKTFGGEKNPEGIETQQMRQKKIEKVSQLAYDRAILSESMRCASPSSNNKNYTKEYNDIVVPLETRKREAVKDIQFIQDVMMRMGSDFISDIDEIKRYKDILVELPNSGYGFRVENGVTYVEHTSKTGKMSAEANAFGNKEAETQTKKIERPYQKVILKKNPDLWKKFEKEFVPKWESYMTAQMFSNGTYGLLSDKKGLIESKYRSYAFECSEVKFSRKNRNLDRMDPMYATELNKFQESCRADLSKRELDGNEAKNLMKKYLAMLDTAVKDGRSAQAGIWTFESLYLGVTPIVPDTSNPKYAQDVLEQQTKNASIPKDNCKMDLSPGDQQRLNLELQANSNDITQEILQTNTERQLRQNAKDEEQRAAMEEISKKADGPANTSEKHIIKSPPTMKTKGI